MKKWNLYNISNARNILLGLATILVVFYHCYDLNFDNRLLFYLRDSGKIGVDIFLFLSGIGLYFSYSNNSNIKEFYKRRFKKILPPLLIVSSIYYLYKGVNIINFIKGISLLSFYIDGAKEFWFFGLLIPLYLLFPYLYKIINEKDIKGLIMLLLISIIPTILLMLFFNNFYLNYEFVLTRIPVFLIGIYSGKYIMNKKEIPEIYFFIFLSLFVEYSIALYYFNVSGIILWYIYCLLSITIVFLIAYIYSKVKVNILNNILIFIGTFSMEIYLIFDKIDKELKIFSNVSINYLLVFLITVILSYILKKVCKYVIK